MLNNTGAESFLSLTMPNIRLNPTSALLAQEHIVTIKELGLFGNNENQQRTRTSGAVFPGHVTHHPAKRTILDGMTVRVRWIDHKCKVNSDEFDREATLHLR